MQVENAGVLAATHVTLAQFQAANAAIFPTEDSLRWYLRTHRRALLDGCALTQIAGRLLIAPEAFTRVAAAIGREKLLGAL